MITKNELKEIIKIAIDYAIDLWVFDILFVKGINTYKFYRQFDNEISRMDIPKESFERLQHLLKKLHD